MPTCPVLIIHSTGDNLFPSHHAEEMYRAAQEPKHLGVVEGVRHINPISGYEAEYREEILRFFGDALGR